jgi:diguanylate cyclase (GGDEF)-like protein/PAS domain S-box-containing protein
VKRSAGAYETNSQSRQMLFRAFLAIAFVAVVQCVFLALLTDAQSDTAHIIDISGSQRMRSQRIAVLTIAAHDGQPLPGWRVELDRTLGELAEGRRALAPRHDLRVSPVGPDGLTTLGRSYLRYEDAARRIERDPSDAAAYAYIVHNRLALLARLDDAVHIRSARFVDHNRLLVAAIFVGLVGQLVGIAVVLLRVFLPSIKRADTAFARLEESQQQFYSLFAQNPDLIAIYDRQGHVVLGNRAATRLLKTGEAAIGEHFSNHVVDEELALVNEAFETARSGQPVSIETTFKATDGERIAVHATIFPQFSGTEIAGVIGVAKDVSALKAAEADYREQSERIAELYTLSATQGMTWEKQIDRTMSTAAGRLHHDFSVLCELRGDSLVPIASIGSSGIETGLPLPLEQTLSNQAIASGDVWHVDNLTTFAYPNAATKRGWGSVVVVPLEINGTTYGTFSVGSWTPRAHPFSEDDRHYMSLVSSLLAFGLQRAQQQRALDALAFFDQLTGLPNRRLMHESLDLLIDDAYRYRSSFAVHYVDLDLFKSINDTYGHAMGDTVLRLAASRMKDCVRAGDVVARVGGDEFVILQRLSKGPSDAAVLAERLVETIAVPFVVDGVSHEIGASVGISICDAADEKVLALAHAEPSTILALADEALYSAKRRGRNRFEFASRANDSHSLSA